MKFYGHANLQQNQLQNAALETLSNFPSFPVVGQIAFVNSIVYVCVDLGDDLPVWVPMTREITSYTHTQNSGSVEWEIEHNLNTTEVNVQIFGANNKMLIPDEIEVIDPDNVVVTFTSSTTGRAVVLTGHFDGNVKPSYAYTHHQTSSSTSWVITHNLGYHPIVRVFVGNQEVQPVSIIHDSTNQVTITFSTAKVGYARLI